MFLILLPVLLSVVRPLEAIECYSGFKLMSGQPIHPQRIQCSHPDAQCYNMTLSAGNTVDFMKLGCSVYRCMLSRDHCIKTTFKNVPVSLCCCRSDKCNAVKNSYKQVEEYDAESDHQEGEKWSPEEITNLFASAEIDEDLPLLIPQILVD